MNTGQKIIGREKAPRFQYTDHQVRSLPARHHCGIWVIIVPVIVSLLNRVEVAC
jgi:hypothetical protein